MSPPLIPRGIEMGNKWSLTPLFSQGPGRDLPLRREQSAHVHCLSAELSGVLSAGHNEKSPSTVPASASHVQHSWLSGTADNLAGPLT